jgi:hypothetical protein
MTDRNKNETKVINIWNEEEYHKDPRYDHASTDKTHHKYNPKNFQYFGENKIALMLELRQHHPDLQGLILTKHTQVSKTDNVEVDWIMVLCEVAAYCEVILDGEYSEEELEKLAGILLGRLVAERTKTTFHVDDTKNKET